MQNIYNKIGKTQSKLVEQYDLENNLIKTWESINHASRELNYNKSGISQCCNNKSKTYKNFKWRFNDPDLPNETWVELSDNLKGLFISNCGRFYSKQMNKSFGSKSDTNYMTTQYKNKNYSIARLVLIAFIEPLPSDKHFAHHIDGNTLNNNSNNLCWSTRTDNNFQYYSNNIISRKNNTNAIIQLNNDDIIINKFNSLKDAAKSLNIKPNAISMCINGKNKTCAGFQWKYADDPDLENEIWKTHPILNIKVSNLGRIHTKYCKTFGSLSQNIYYKYNKYFVHKLVAETFIDNLENKKTVDHIDGNTKNNCVENLCWATMKEQVANRGHKKNK